MKNRKLFAIITLVAFMLTMMPMMAFAAVASDSTIEVEDGSAKVGTALEFIVDLDAQLAEGQWLVLFAERNGSLSDADEFVMDDANGIVAQGPGYILLDSIAGAEELVEVESDVAGTVTIKAFILSGAEIVTNGELNYTVAELYNGTTEFIKTALVGNGVKGTFKAADNAISAEYVVDGATYDEDDANANDVIVIDHWYAANDGIDVYEVTVKLFKGESKLSGEDITLSVDKNGATLNKEEITTKNGKAEFKISATKPGTYTVTVEAGSYSQEVAFVFVSTALVKAEFSSTVAGTIAVDNKENKAMKLAVYDGNDNAVSAADLIEWTGSKDDAADYLADVFEVECTSAPEDSSFEDELFDINVDADDIYVSFTPDAEGEYTFKVYNINTGKNDTTSIAAAEFGTISHATISYPSATYLLGEKTQAPTIKVVDKNGVKKNASSSKFSYTGLGVANIANNGQITFKADNDYAGNEIIVTVVANNKYAASTTLTIGNEPAAIVFADATGAVGEEVTVNFQVVDVDGNNAAISAQTEYDVEVQSALIVEKPEGAAVSVDADALGEDGTAEKDLLKKGKGAIKVVSNKEGTVKANVVLKLTAKNAVKKDGIEYAAGEYFFFLSGTAVVGFGAPAVDDGETSTVTLIIGSTTFVANGEAKVAPVAPVVVDGRTLVPVRAFAEATGAEVVYNDTTKVIDITAPGLVAQMTVGSNILTVNGETVVMDSAAQLLNGSTVLPVRYAGAALGYDFECAYGVDGAVTSVTMFK